MSEKKTSRIEAAAVLAVFSFAFLGSEFFFDTRMGIFVGPAEVVGAQNLVLGASVLGFLAYAFIVHTLPSRARTAAALVGAAAVCACLTGEAMAPSASRMLAIGVATFFLLGILGGGAHWAAARALRNDGALSRTVGSGYAFGIALQFANNQIAPAGELEVAVLCVGCLTLVALLVAMREERLARARARDEEPAQASALGKPAAAGTVSTAYAGNEGFQAAGKRPHVAERPTGLSAALGSLALVVGLSFLFSTLDNVATMANAEGTVDLGGWPRLFLAASGLAAGFLFDAKEDAYRGIVMFCVALLSTCSLLATEAGAGPLLGIIVFYLGSGFFVVFFTAAFLSLAPQMRVPEVWAGMGRAANNLGACLLSGASLALVQTGNTALVMIAAIALFVLIAVCFAASGQLRAASPSTEQAAKPAPTNIPPVTVPAPTPSEEERASSFASRYGLTPRETDVLKAVVADERPLKQIASDLGISLRMVQKHLASLYGKTETQTRSGLTKKFME